MFTGKIQLARNSSSVSLSVDFLFYTSNAHNTDSFAKSENRREDFDVCIDYNSDSEYPDYIMPLTNSFGLSQLTAFVVLDLYSFVTKGSNTC